MSPSPAAPSTASISACASTSPSEWPARPRRMIERDAAEHERHAVARARARRRRCRRGSSRAAPPAARRGADANRLGRRLVQVAPRAAADVHARPCRPRAPGRRRCRRGRPRTRSSQARARLERRSRVRRTPAHGFATPQRADEPTHVDVRAAASSSATTPACCRRAATSRPRGAQRARHGERVGVEVARLASVDGRMLDAEDLPARRRGARRARRGRRARPSA